MLIFFSSKEFINFAEQNEERVKLMESEKKNLFENDRVNFQMPQDISSEFLSFFLLDTSNKNLLDFCCGSKSDRKVKIVNPSNALRELNGSGNSKIHGVPNREKMRIAT